VATERIGIGLIGAGWMGNEHSQAYCRIPETWPEANFEPVLVHVGDKVPAVAEACARAVFNGGQRRTRHVPFQH